MGRWQLHWKTYRLPLYIATCPWPVKMPTLQSPSLLVHPAPSVMAPEWDRAQRSPRWQSKAIYRSLTAKEHRAVQLHSPGPWPIFLYCWSTVHHSQICTSSLLDQRWTWSRLSLCPTQSHFHLTVSCLCHSSQFCRQFPHFYCLIPLTYFYCCLGFQAHFSGSQPSMKFVMDTSKFWFRPHVSRAEGENLITKFKR